METHKEAILSYSTNSPVHVVGVAFILKADYSLL